MRFKLKKCHFDCNSSEKELKKYLNAEKSGIFGLNFEWKCLEKSQINVFFHKNAFFYMSVLFSSISAYLNNK